MQREVPTTRDMHHYKQLQDYIQYIYIMYIYIYLYNVYIYIIYLYNVYIYIFMYICIRMYVRYTNTWPMQIAWEVGVSFLFNA